MAEVYPTKTVQQKTFDEFIKQYSVLIKQQTITFENAVQEIMTTMTANPETASIGYVQEDIEAILNGQQKKEGLFTKALQTLTSMTKKSAVKEEEQAVFTKEISENIKENNDFVAKQSEGNKELIEYAKGEAAYIADSNKALEGMTTIMKATRTPSEGIGEIKDYVKGEYDVVVADNKAVEIAALAYNALKGWKNDVKGMFGIGAQSEEEQYYDDMTMGMDELSEEGMVTNQMLDDINGSLVDGQLAITDGITDTADTQTQMLATISDTLTDSTAASDQYAEEQTQMLGDISTTMGDQYDLEQEAYLRQLREDAGGDGKKGLSWVQKFFIGLGVGLMLGAYLRSLLLPFEVAIRMVTGKWLDMAKLGGKIGNQIKKLRDWWVYSGGVMAFFTDWIVRLSKPFRSLFGWATGLGDAFKKLAISFKSSSFVTFFTKGLKGLGDIFGKANKAIGTLGKTGSGISRFVDSFVDVFGSLFKEWRANKNKIGATIIAFKKVIRSIDFVISSFVDTLKVGKVGGFLTPILKFVKVFFTYFKGLRLFLSPMYAGFLGGLKGGFKWLGWPLTFLFGVIDFIKGFAKSTETTLLGKIKDGLISAVMGFIEMPLRLIGWIADKVLGIFGVEIEGGIGNKLVEGVKWLLDGFFELLAPLWAVLKLGMKAISLPMTIIMSAFHFVMGFFKSEETSIIGKLKDGVKAALMGFIELPATLLGWAIDNILDLFGAEIEGGAFAAIENIISTIVDTVFGVFEWLWSNIFKPIIDVWTWVGKKYFKAVMFVIDKMLWMADLLRDIFTGNWDGIKDKWTALIEWIKGLPGRIKDWVADKLKSVPGVKTLIAAGTAVAEKASAIKKGVISFFTGGGDEDVGGGEEVAGAARGGLTLSSGLAFLHPNEIIGPANEIIPQIINESRAKGVGDMVGDVYSGEAKLKKEGNFLSRKIESILNSTNTTLINNIKEEKRIKQGEKGGQDARAIMMGARQVIEPPADIEALGLLFFNKTWGIA